MRRQAAIDGQIIDPWHLAALIEGVRFRLDSSALIDRGAMFAAADRRRDRGPCLARQRRRAAPAARRARPVLAATAVDSPALPAAQRRRGIARRCAVGARAVDRRISRCARARGRGRDRLVGEPRGTRIQFGELDRWLDLPDQAIQRAQRLLEEYSRAALLAAVDDPVRVSVFANGSG